MSEPAWLATTLTKNRERLLAGEVAREFLAAVVRQVRRRGLVSSEHLSVDGTMIEAWASQKSFRPKQCSEGKDDEDGAAGGGGTRPSTGGASSGRTRRMNR